ncbi:hypothetical protein Ciccas_002300 [Cichlidogyrus casuarinus]|uniref:C2H2-type domain-containing protein n=1 Tax=Cichlidogyrus casuarinus TaxID=1844966 RepID=A0ABD2QHK8_9PLAT
MNRHIRLLHKKVSNISTKQDISSTSINVDNTISLELTSAEQASIVKCPICEKSLKNQRVLNKHVKHFHQGKSCICPMCYQTFSCGTSLARHKKLVHSNSLQICSVCNVAFPTRFALIGHNLTVHNTSSVFACQFCAHCFPTVQTRQDHMKRLHESKSDSDPDSQKDPPLNSQQPAFPMINFLSSFPLLVPMAIPSLMPPSQNNSL